MRMSAPKHERKRLDRSMQKCADQTASRLVPAAETRNRTQLARQLHRHRQKRRPNGLICAQSGVNVTGTAFYLGNVGLLRAILGKIN
jgi:hypothetical protein